MLMRKFFIPIVLAVFLLQFALPQAARADGIIIPDPLPCPFMPCLPPMEQLEIRYHKVNVTIDNQIAVTHVDQVFYNPQEYDIEGSYIFPVPREAVVTAFTLWVDGKPVEGEVLSAEQARQEYEEIVRSLRDPALLEYAGTGALRARIFPIPAHGERRVELEYTQALLADNGLVRYTYPLSTEKFSARPLEQVAVNVDIRSQAPLRAVYSLSHPVDIARLDERHVQVGYEDENVLPDTDFTLFYSLGEGEAFHLFTYRDPNDLGAPDGFFALMLAPRTNVDVAALPKDVLLVLDRSGSMEGEKFSQAQGALKYILEHLNAQDRFNIISFSTGLEQYATDLRPASEAAQALPWVGSLSARGSTDINLALLEAAAIADKERPTYLIFMTDGLPTQGVVESAEILKNFAAAASANIRLFAFGVGYDVDTYLLDSLAQGRHGASSYVLPEQNLDESLSGFYEKISTPVLVDLELDFGDIEVYDIYPDPLPDLFRGSQVLVVGRYRQGGVGDVVLSGWVEDERQTFRFSNQNFASDTSREHGPLAAVPRLWATRKIGYLLNHIRLNGPDQEIIEQIVRLSVRYGIVTPYTSYLVTEPDALGWDAQTQIAQQAYQDLQAAPAAPASGQKAVERAADEGALAGANSVQAAPAETANLVRVIGAHTFKLSNGIWMDTNFDVLTMQAYQVTFLSDDYFRLAQERPDLAAAFALGENVIVVSNGMAYQVISDTPPQPGQATPVSPLPLLTQSAPTQPGNQTAATQSPAATPRPARPSAWPCGSLGGALLIALGAAFLGKAVKQG